jgi:hypothetical protein
VAYVVNNYGVVGKVQFINDAVVSDPAAPGSLCTGEFAIRGGGGLFSQSVKCFKYLPYNLGGKFFQILLNRRFQ